MWRVVIHPDALGGLRAHPIHPLDRVTLRDRLRGLRKRLLETRGRPPDTAPADHIVPGCVRFVYDRLDCLYTVHTETRRSWK